MHFWGGFGVFFDFDVIFKKLCFSPLIFPDPEKNKKPRKLKELQLFYWSTSEKKLKNYMSRGSNPKHRVHRHRR